MSCYSRGGRYRGHGGARVLGVQQGVTDGGSAAAKIAIWVGRPPGGGPCSLGGGGQRDMLGRGESGMQSGQVIGL
jgi:hypothetical protein